MEVEAKRTLKKLRKLINRADNDGPVLKDIGEHIASLVDLGFVDSTDPYGDIWAPITHRDGDPLEDSGRLRGSITSDVFSGVVAVGTSVEYAGVHQDGTDVITQRMIVPEQESGLPSAWTDDIIDIMIHHFDIPI